MKGNIAALVMAIPLALGYAFCGHHPDGPPQALHVSARDRSSGWLGVGIQDMTDKLAQKKNLKTNEGAYVNEIVDDSPADSAGIKEGDVIVEFDGKKVDDADDLVKAVRKTKPGTEVAVSLMREEQRKSIKVILGESRRRREVRVVVPPIPPIPPMQFHQGSSLYGMSVMELSDQLGEYFEAPGGNGVLVERVKKGSDAEKAGFKAGDVIIRVGKAEVADIDDIWQAMDNYKDGEKIDVEILRKGAKKMLTLEADEAQLGSRMHFRFDHMPRILKHNDLDLKRLEELDSAPDADEMELEIEKAQRAVDEAQEAFDKQEFKQGMEELKHELKQIPEQIREQMKNLREQLKEIKEQREV